MNMCKLYLKKINDKTEKIKKKLKEKEEVEQNISYVFKAAKQNKASLEVIIENVKLTEDVLKDEKLKLDALCKEIRKVEKEVFVNYTTDQIN